MKLKNILNVILLLMTGYISSVQAISIGFDSGVNSINLGESISLGINVDFSEESFGGTFEINYDKDILTNPGFSFVSDTELADLGIQPDVSKFDFIKEGIVNLSLGTLSFSEGVFGRGILGYLTFDSISAGQSALGLKDELGGFTDFNTFTSQQVDYQGTSVNVISSVPLPASVWLFVSAFGFLVTRRKKSI